MNEIRIDKWLWTMRIYKTRTQASEACIKGRICISDTDCKASRLVRIGDVIDVRKPPYSYSYKVKQISENRLSAKMITDFIDDLSDISHNEKIYLNSQNKFVTREVGTGRPTKKERRTIDNWISDSK